VPCDLAQIESERSDSRGSEVGQMLSLEPPACGVMDRTRLPTGADFHRDTVARGAPRGTHNWLTRCELCQIQHDQLLSEPPRVDVPMIDTESASANGNGKAEPLTPPEAPNATQSQQAMASPSRIGFCWEPLNSRAFFERDCRQDWLIRRAVVKDQPLVIGGPQKTLKTSIALDLCISIASGTPWLGEFPAPQPMRVAIFSGESGEFTLQETGRRICTAKGITPEALEDKLLWQFCLPQLSNDDQLKALRVGLKRDGVQVVIIDPLYLSLLAGAVGIKAENLFETGPLLMHITQICHSVGATLILVHHTTKPSARKNEPLDLTDLAFSGIAEFARQFILVNRREPFEPGSGKHNLWLVVGGSVGHSGQYALDIDEGTLADDFTGRCWSVAIKRATDVRSAERSKRKAEKEQQRKIQDEADEAAVMDAIDQLNKRGGKGQATKTRLRNASKISESRTDKALERLTLDKRVQAESVEVPGGQGAKQTANIYRRGDATSWEGA